MEQAGLQTRTLGLGLRVDWKNFKEIAITYEDKERRERGPEAEETE